jgi:hypothetical protein
MSEWKRIFLICLVLIGSTAVFAYYSLNQFNNALDDLSASFTSSILKTPISSEKKTKENIKINVNETEIEPASASLEVDSTLQPITETAETVDSGSFFIFPKINEKIYSGCTYKISFQDLIQSSKVENLDIVEIALIDAGSKKSIEPTESGLMLENKIEPKLKSLNWSVGLVWPGKYYIKLLNIKEEDVGLGKIRSNIFSITRMPKNLNIDDKKEICQETGGWFNTDN